MTLKDLPGDFPAWPFFTDWHGHAFNCFSEMLCRKINILRQVKLRHGILVAAKVFPDPSQMPAPTGDHTAMNHSGFPLSAITVRPNATAPAHPHAALIFIVGWAGVSSRGECYVGPVRVKSLPEAWIGQRVRATLTPSTNYPTIETLGPCWIRRIRAAGATEKNSASFQIVGHLIRAEKSPQRIKVSVSPTREGFSRFWLVVRTTHAAIQKCDSGWTGVRVTGSLLDQLLLAENIQPAYAPMAAHWTNWRPPLRRGSKKRKEKASAALLAAIDAAGPEGMVHTSDHQELQPQAGNEQRPAPEELD